MKKKKEMFFEDYAEVIGILGSQIKSKDIKDLCKTIEKLCIEISDSERKQGKNE